MLLHDVPTVADVEWRGVHGYATRGGVIRRSRPGEVYELEVAGAAEPCFEGFRDLLGPSHSVGMAARVERRFRA